MLSMLSSLTTLHLSSFVPPPLPPPYVSFLERVQVDATSGICMMQGSWGEAAKKLAQVVDDDTFRSLEGKSKHQLWLELCDIITRHPDLVRGMKVDAILRSGIRKFTDEVSPLSLPLLGKGPGGRGGGWGGEVVR